MMAIMKQVETFSEIITLRLCFDVHFCFDDQDLEGQHDVLFLLGGDLFKLFF